MELPLGNCPDVARTILDLRTAYGWLRARPWVAAAGVLPHPGVLRRIELLRTIAGVGRLRGDLNWQADRQVSGWSRTLLNQVDPGQIRARVVRRDSFTALPGRREQTEEQFGMKASRGRHAVPVQDADLLSVMS